QTQWTPRREDGVELGIIRAGGQTGTGRLVTSHTRFQRGPFEGRRQIKARRVRFCLALFGISRPCRSRHHRVLHRTADSSGSLS
ncbi:hypothetical protein ACYOEI_23685, partial [Singulisphaera rosea]